MLTALSARPSQRPQHFITHSDAAIRLDSVHLHDGRRRPGPVKNTHARPVRPEIQREIGILWRGQPVRALSLWRWIGLHVDCERPVAVVRQLLVLGPERISLKFIRSEEVMFVI